MNMGIYGYKIGVSVVFCVSPPHLMNTLNGKSVKLRSTMSKLLLFLIEHANMNKVGDDVIMEEVFEFSGLRHSPQRLRQAVNALEKLLAGIGMGRRLTCRVDGNGYAILNTTVSVIYNFCEDEPSSHGN